MLIARISVALVLFILLIWFIASVHGTSFMKALQITSLYLLVIGSLMLGSVFIFGCIDFVITGRFIK
jgi:hypothetical protein